MLLARQALIKKAFHEEQSSKTSGLTLASRLSYELGLYGKNKIQWKLWNIEKNGWMKNGHSKDGTSHITSKTKSKRVSKSKWL